MIYQMYDILNTIVFVILAYIFMQVFCFSKIKPLAIKVIMLMAWIITEILVSEFLSDLFILKAILTIVVSFVFSLLLFKDASYKILILAFVDYGVMGILEFVTYSLYNSFLGYVALSELNSNVSMIIGGVTSQILFLITVIVLGTVLKKEKLQKVNANGWIRILAFPIISLLVVFSPVFLVDTELSEKECLFLLILGIVILAFNLYMYYVLHFEAEYLVTKENIVKLRNHANELASLYDQICKQQDKLSSKEHEYRNSLALITSYIKDKKWDSLSEYIDRESISAEEGRIIDIGNTIVSTIINAKYWEAVYEGIQVRITADNISNASIDDNSWLIIFANLFNNAIEACKKLEKDKFINIKILNFDETIVIVFTNSYNGVLKRKGDVFLSTKDDSDIHGYGIRNIIDTVHILNGDIDFVSQDQWFEVRILIPQ